MCGGIYLQSPDVGGMRPSAFHKGTGAQGWRVAAEGSVQLEDFNNQS